MTNVIDISDKMLLKQIDNIDRRTFEIVGPYDITLCNNELGQSKDTCKRYQLRTSGGKVFVPFTEATIRCEVYLP